MAINNAPLPVINRETAPKASPNPPLPDLKRRDTWWLQPLLVFLGFTAFIVYTTWRAFENNYFEAAQNMALVPHLHLQYLSPFYSPKIATNWMLFGKHISPALFILPVPLLFRGTCYYYRKAYYRAFFWDPAACAVPEVAKRRNYTGEREFPLVIQNIHRYAFYLAALVMVVLWYDALLAFTALDDSGGRHFYLGLGSLIFLINVTLLSLYTFGCHSFRHLSGGCLNCFSCSSGAKTRHGLWERITHLNENHALWAWCSLFSVGLTDFYVRCLATGAIPHDVRFF